MVCNLDFANNTILLCFLFLNYWIILFNQIIAQILNLIAELVILTGTPTKEENIEMETHPVIVEITIS